MKNKIIFWMDAFLLHYCLAFYMQKKYDAEYYGIVDISNKPKSFFQTQELLKLKKFWFYHDQIHSDKKPDLDYLSKFEGHNEIMGYPTLLKLSLGKKDKEYNGDRSTDSIVEFVEENFGQKGGKSARKNKKKTH